MADNNNDSVGDITQKTAAVSLSAKAKEFKPTFNSKAPAFVPRSFAPKPAAAASDSTSAPAPKPMSISIGGAPKPAAAAAPAPAPAPAAAAPAAAPESKPEPATKPEPKPKASSSPDPALPTISESREVDEDVLLDEHFKEHLNVIFIGHVDAGKSTLGGNILYLTEMVDKRTMEKYEREAKEAGRESWYLSWALDTNQEERAKGKTVECGRAYFETAKRRYTILDAPGHKNFVPSMLGGAAQADVGVLVISARKGEFETGFERGGQTREHALLAKTAGVRRLIVAINKMDDPTVKWDKARYDEIITKLTPFLRTAGYPKSDIIFMPISGFTGAGVKDRLTPSVCSWYSGPSLLGQLDDMQAIDRKINGPLRIPVSEKFSDMGTIISGKIESGHIKVNQKVTLMPDKRTCEVSAIYGEDESEVQMAICGDNVRIKLRGVDERDVKPGYVLTDVKNPCHTTRAFEAQLQILDVKSIVAAGYKSVMHVHTAIEDVTIGKLVHKLNKKGQKSKVPPPFVKKGEACIARIEVHKAVCIEKFADFPQLGRFTLRDEGNTIAIGKVLRVAKPSSAVNAE
ncbi:translation termination factor GTPase eRF3 [Coemansia erecta]|uniref:Eukaryotic peptide chain release factor GTP-binding subunit n=1 Tax=Coemansia erecta TaxID=147472 RepID=A0A9W8CRW6_9FUNG|nr:translation termination factor GTPase eRF3 [Coemansia erecta]